jgi:hypothetical protein
MKTKMIVTALALFSTTVLARPYCESGQGYWTYEEQQIRVCDTVTENYTESRRVCDFSGTLDLNFFDRIDYPPFGSGSIYETDRQILNVDATCPSSVYKSRFNFYSYWDRTTGRIDSRFANFSGFLSLISNVVETQNKTRTIETNCRIENRTVRVWRCGMEP